MTERHFELLKNAKHADTSIDSQVDEHGLNQSIKDAYHRGASAVTGDKDGRLYDIKRAEGSGARSSIEREGLTLDFEKDIYKESAAKHFKGGSRHALSELDKLGGGGRHALSEFDKLGGGGRHALSESLDKLGGEATSRGAIDFSGGGKHGLAEHIDRIGNDAASRGARSAIEALGDRAFEGSKDAGAKISARAALESVRNSSF